MTERLLAGVRVLDLAGEPAAMAGRILADLGADVTRIGPTLDGTTELAWGAHKTTATMLDLLELYAGADIVLATPGWPGTVAGGPGAAPNAVWVDVTPFGGLGPRAHWRASDLGTMAATGNLFATGDPDRPPVRCAAPVAWCHAGPETVIGALTALASGVPQHVDVSIQEAVLVANMGAVGRFFRIPSRGSRSGAQTGRTREIWPCRDGWVSFGLRGGKARVANLELISLLVDDAGLGTPALTDRDWANYNHNTVTDEELRAIEAPIAEYFATRTMDELYTIACETNLMLAPANSPGELFRSAQLASRRFFAPLGDVENFPQAFAAVRAADGEVEGATPRWPAGTRHYEAGSWPARTADRDWLSDNHLRSAVSVPGAGSWAGTNILEFGSGAAGPIATRFFAEHGATVLRIESKTRPDFLRVYALGPKNPHGLEGADMFDALNVGKRSVALNMKHPQGVAIARRLVLEWADAVAENFAPKAMRGFGMDYDALATEKPDLVMVSACLQGQTGPHKDYPGFGGQGSALAGFNFLTGWPDRAPIGPSGTITDSLAPRFVAAALAAGLLYRRRTGRGAYIDLAQVEAATWSLSPWLLDFAVHGTVTERRGNDDPRALVHGLFPCAGEDRWVAIVAWTDDEVARIKATAGDDLTAWTTTQTPLQVADALQAVGIEAVPVQDFRDCFEDPQLAHRGHLVALDHPYMGEGRYERNGFRLSRNTSDYDRPGPTIGQDTAWVLSDVLGLSREEQDRLAADGVLE
jgi:crotonobetainyl-CoA:carnitine CoA-transferase CaiB-like acyl-CoA transferase